MQETWVQSLGQEDLLEKEMATPSSIPAWEIPWREEPGGLQSMGSQTARHDWAAKQQQQPRDMEEDSLLYINQDYKVSKINFDHENVEVKYFGKRWKDKQQNKSKIG